jgi:glyoxylase-like metal-dependent hydrolase (beta-lactamase superfamily II)
MPHARSDYFGHAAFFDNRGADFRAGIFHRAARQKVFMKIIPLVIPTPFYIGAVNVYLIKEDPLTLIDVGPKTAEAAEALRKKLRENDVRLADIKRIVLTHAHEDHCGLAKQVRDEARGAEIFVHKWETGHLFGRLARAEHKSLLLRAGVPETISAKCNLFTRTRPC